MKIAILGAGFCGLATAWFLKPFNIHQITLFDKRGIGKGTSSIAAGLLHAYAGAHSKKNWRAEEGLGATKELIKVAEQALQSPIVNFSGVFRPAISEAQKIAFKKTAAKYPDVRWSENEFSHPGIFIETGMTIDCPRYIEGLWKANRMNGVLLKEQQIVSLSELDEFDLIIITAGAETIDLKECQHLPITKVKGQVLEFHWPKEWPILPCPINCQSYLLNLPEKQTAIVGATFERDFTSTAPDTSTALELLMPKLHEFFPLISKDLNFDCRAGIRASTPDHHPLIQQISNKVWIFSGMGSKGLLYHALYAQELVKKLAQLNILL